MELLTSQEIINNLNSYSWGDIKKSFEQELRKKGETIEDNVWLSPFVFYLIGEGIELDITNSAMENTIFTFYAYEQFLNRSPGGYSVGKANYDDNVRESVKLFYEKIKDIKHLRKEFEDMRKISIYTKLFVGL